MTSESDLWTVVEEPSMEDFETAKEEEPHVGARHALFRVVRVVGTLLVILALLLYFIVPLNNVFMNVPNHWQRPNTGLHKIPLAPQRPSSPKLRSYHEGRPGWLQSAHAGSVLCAVRTGYGSGDGRLA